MPHSSEGERAVAGSGEQERALAGSSKGGRALLRSPDYPCTARLRLRRLLAYLRRHSYEHIYDVARDKLVVIFDVRYLVDRVMFGVWRTACNYLIRFVDPTSMSYESRLLLGFLQKLMVLSGVADGKHMMASSVSNWFVSIYGKPVLAAYPCFATLVADVLFLGTDHASPFSVTPSRSHLGAACLHWRDAPHRPAASSPCPPASVVLGAARSSARKAVRDLPCRSQARSPPLAGGRRPLPRARPWAPPPAVQALAAFVVSPGQSPLWMRAVVRLSAASARLFLLRFSDGGGGGAERA
ncbi:hypothetical protein C2845_PM15G21510 [Panicum miliaceum]|uniref:Uncharacterized protein n=1 Tax=Panicum miliaceum TaxID=4540 RepID=A0A3L6Q495_PANMI|nr:hypothetical protein C2845_PM15G21510 [Panicum miliaceum]